MLIEKGLYFFVYFAFFFLDLPFCGRPGLRLSNQLKRHVFYGRYSPLHKLVNSGQRAEKLILFESSVCLEYKVFFHFLEKLIEYFLRTKLFPFFSFCIYVIADRLHATGVKILFYCRQIFGSEFVVDFFQFLIYFGEYFGFFSIFRSHFLKFFPVFRREYGYIFGLGFPIDDKGCCNFKLRHIIFALKNTFCFCYKPDRLGKYIVYFIPKCSCALFKCC